MPPRKTTYLLGKTINYMDFFLNFNSDKLKL